MNLDGIRPAVRELERGKTVIVPEASNLDSGGVINRDIRLDTAREADAGQSDYFSSDCVQRVRIGLRPGRDAAVDYLAAGKSLGMTWPEAEQYDCK